MYSIFSSMLLCILTQQGQTNLPCGMMMSTADDVWLKNNTNQSSIKFKLYEFVVNLSPNETTKGTFVCFMEAFSWWKHVFLWICRKSHCRKEFALDNGKTFLEKKTYHTFLCNFCINAISQMCPKVLFDTSTFMSIYLKTNLNWYIGCFGLLGN